MSDGTIVTAAQREELVRETRKLAEMARHEDLGRGDISSRLVADQGEGLFRVIAKQEGVFCGREIGQVVLDAYATGLQIDWLDDGIDGLPMIKTPVELAEIEGNVSDILSAERVLLNFLQRLSGIATLTSTYVDAVDGTNAVILDTRKTTPGWRILEKYAVRCGGAQNHRMGLHDAILLKDNHLAHLEVTELQAGLAQMLDKASELDPPPTFVEVEADTIEQVEQILKVPGVDIVMLDNFTLEDTRMAIDMRSKLGLAERVKYEASGGVTLDTVREIAKTGVDYISVGALTHSAVAVDLSLERVE